MRAAAFILLLGFAFPALGTWTFERVDSAGWGAAVRVVREPGGALLLGYENSATGAVRLARKDSVWHYEDVPRPESVGPGGVALAVSAMAGVGVTYADGVQARLAWRRDSEWVHSALPCLCSPAWPEVPLTFDSAARPSVLVQESVVGSYTGALVVARLEGSVWAGTDTLDMAGHSPQYVPFASGTRPGGTMWGAYWLNVYDAGLDWSGLYTFRQQGGWQRQVVESGNFYWFTGHSADVDREGSVHVCYWANGGDSQPAGFRYDGAIIDSGSVAMSALRIDSLDRPQIAFVRGPELRFGYRDARGWHISEPGVGTPSAIDLAVDSAAQPVIAYAVDGGLFLAHGSDITAVEEGRNVPGRIASGPTIVRGVLRLDKSWVKGHEPWVLVDAAGRCVLTRTLDASNPRTLSIDVSGLGSGVFFACGARGKNAVKVIIER